MIKHIDVGVVCDGDDCNESTTIKLEPHKIDNISEEVDAALLLENWKWFDWTNGIPVTLEHLCSKCKKLDRYNYR